MNITRICAAILIHFSISNGVAQDEKALPTGAASLKSKLESWEAEKRKDLEEEIRAQRQKVISALNSHLKSATQRGDLDGAIAIRQYIKTLSDESGPPTAAKIPSTGPTKSTTSKRDFEKYLKTVQFVFPDGMSFYYSDGMRVRKYPDGKTTSLPAEIDPDRKTITWEEPGYDNGRSITITGDSTAEVPNKNGLKLQMTIQPRG